MNHVVLVGNLTDDPTLRYTQSGKAVANFTIAVSHRRWVPSSVDPSGGATSTASAEEQNGNGSSRAASQPSGSEDRRRSDEKKDGHWQEVTDGFFSVTCWNSLAENIAGSLKKGSRVLVAGKLVQRTFEQDGVKRTVVEIVASRVAADLQFASAEITKATREKQSA